MPAAAAKLDPDTLAPGWAAEDVARLAELADLGMDLARTLTKQVLAHDAACERGEAKPVSAADAARIALDFSRIARSVRLTLTLKAHARDPAAPSAVPQTASSRATSTHQAEPESRPRALYLDHPIGPDDPEDFDDPVQCAEYGRAVIRQALDHALGAPDYEPAERERLYEALELRLERETEAGKITVNAGSSSLIGRIAKDLGLDDRCRVAQDENGQFVCWAVSRHGEDLHPLILPADKARLSHFKRPWTKPPDP